MKRRAAARGDSGGRFFFVYLAPRLVAAGPAFGGERGSLPRTVSILGTPPDGCRWLSWGLRRHLAVRAGPECARLLHDAAGAQPRPPPKAGPGAPRYGFRDLADSSTDRTLCPCSCPHSGLTERTLHREYGGWQITHDEFGLEPHDAIPGAGELAVPARIRRARGSCATVRELNLALRRWRARGSSSRSSEISPAAHRRHVVTSSRRHVVTSSRRHVVTSSRRHGE